MPSLRVEAPVLANRGFSGNAVAKAPTWSASHGGALMGEMKRAIAREEQDRRTQDRFTMTIPKFWSKH